MKKVSGDVFRHSQPTVGTRACANARTRAARRQRKLVDDDLFFRHWNLLNQPSIFVKEPAFDFFRHWLKAGN